VLGGASLLAVLASIRSSVVKNAATIAIITATPKGSTAVRWLFRSLLMRAFHYDMKRNASLVVPRARLDVAAEALLAFWTQLVSAIEQISESVILKLRKAGPAIATLGNAALLFRLAPNTFPRGLLSLHASLQSFATAMSFVPSVHKISNARREGIGDMPSGCTGIARPPGGAQPAGRPYRPP
jgi:hypothetical protein